MANLHLSTQLIVPKYHFKLQQDFPILSQCSTNINSIQTKQPLEPVQNSCYSHCGLRLFRDNFFPILASMHCLKKTLMALSKEEGIQGRKSNSIDYQPNYCLHHNVTFFFSWLHVGYQRFFCVSRYSVIWIFRFWNTWLGYQWLPRWGSGLLLQLIDCVGFAFYFILNTSFSWK